jgi:hypothetical protein
MSLTIAADQTTARKPYALRLPSSGLQVIRTGGEAPSHLDYLLIEPCVETLVRGHGVAEWLIGFGQRAKGDELLFIKILWGKSWTKRTPINAINAKRAITSICPQKPCSPLFSVLWGFFALVLQHNRGMFVSGLSSFIIRGVTVL